MIGTKIRELRKKKGISQAEFAHRIGVTQGFISMTENNSRIPSLEVIETIAKELEVNALELNVNNKSSSIAKLVSHLSGLTESQISILKEIAIQFKSNEQHKNGDFHLDDAMQTDKVDLCLKVYTEDGNTKKTILNNFQPCKNGFIDSSPPLASFSN